MQYIISPITTYNEDELLYETKIGLDDKRMSLLYIAFGKSEETSKERAQNIADLLK